MKFLQLFKNVKFFSSAPLLLADRDSSSESGSDINVDDMMVTNPQDLSSDKLISYRNHINKIVEDPRLVGVDPETDPEGAEQVRIDFGDRSDQLNSEVRLREERPQLPVEPETPPYSPETDGSQINESPDSIGEEENVSPNNDEENVSPSNAEEAENESPSNAEEAENESSSNHAASDTDTKLGDIAGTTDSVEANPSPGEKNTSSSKRKFEEDEDNEESSSLANKKPFKQDSSDIKDDFTEMPGW
jgi:hypothetical protein